MSVEFSPPPADLPPPGPAQAETPPMVVWGFVLSVLGFCGITAIIGIVLGVIGRGQAKQAGKGEGLATAAIAVGAAWLALGAIGGIVGAISGDSRDSGPAPQPDTSTSETETTDPTEAPEPFTSLGVSVSDLPSRWNLAIDSYGVGEPLPNQLPESEGGLPGYSVSELEVSNGNTATIYWRTDTGLVTEIVLRGDPGNPNATANLVANAAAMTYATTTYLTPAEAMTLIDEELIGDSISTFEPGGFIVERLEKPDRVYTFGLTSESVDFSVVGITP